jgi:ATP-dependent RNA circularization protein (DNA/RNA ligase family)
MNQYHKINSVFKRTPDGKKMLFGDYSQEEFQYLADNRWQFTEKVDGTNIRVIYSGGELSFGGKTDNAQIPASLVNKLRDIFKVELFYELFQAVEIDEGWEYPNVCLYGEGFGAKIQNGGKYIADGVDFVLFDIKIGDWWLKREDIESIANKLGIQVVPIIGCGNLHEMVERCNTGFKSQWGDFIAEGIVARPVVELKDRAGHRIITKLKHKDFQDV